MQQVVQHFYGEIRVFEDKQQQQVAGDRHNEQRSSPPLPVGIFLTNQARQNIIDRDRREHHEDELRLTPGIEKQARSEEHQVAGLVVPDHEVQRDHDRQK